jgi:hypothetical protein
MDQIRKVLDEIRQEDGYAFISGAGSEARRDRRSGSQSRHHGEGHFASQAGPVTAAAPKGATTEAR